MNVIKNIITNKTIIINLNKLLNPDMFFFINRHASDQIQKY